MRADSFDEATELFLSNAPTVPEFEPIPLPPWRARPALAAWVAATMLVCTSILAAAFVSID